MLAKSELQYLECHLVDHCNLNCKGCTHFSNLSGPKFTDLQQYTSDMHRLAEIFSNIRIIRLLGGEPLLHDDPCSFIRVTRKSFPMASIRFVTNGILLPKASAQFWEACRNTETALDITLYPPFEKLAPTWEGLCDREGVPVKTYSKNGTFSARINPHGNSDKAEAFRLCRIDCDCPYLRRGRIHTCAMSAHVELFNEKYGAQVTGDSGIDIYGLDVSARKISKYLRTPIETCRWCATSARCFPWSPHKKNEPIQLSDWYAAV